MSVNGLPKGIPARQIDGQTLYTPKINNQFVLFGASPSLLGDDIIVFLEYMEGSGGVIVKDKNSAAISGTLIAPLDLSSSPIRLDGGVIFTGTVLIAKGYYIHIGKKFDSIG